MVENVVFQEDITTQSVANLMSYLDDYTRGVTLDGQPIEIPEKIILNFSTNGGSYSAIMMLVDYINQYPLDLEVVVFDHCCSAGMLFLMFIDVNIRILKSGYGMFHLVDMPLSARELRDKASASAWYQKDLRNCDEFFIKEYEKCGLTYDELRLIKDGKDVYVDSARLMECISSYRAFMNVEEIDARIEDIEFEKSMLSEEKEVYIKQIEEIKALQVKPVKKFKKKKYDK